jgi:hypothetical protein
MKRVETTALLVVLILLTSACGGALSLNPTHPTPAIAVTSIINLRSPKSTRKRWVGTSPIACSVIQRGIRRVGRMISYENGAS